MPEKQTKERADRARAEGKAPSTQAGEFVREEIHHVREGKHGARSTKQAIAIGLSKARRAGVDLRPPKEGTTSEDTRRNAERAYARGHGSNAGRRPSRRRSRATGAALRRERRSSTSREALSKQALRRRQGVVHPSGLLQLAKLRAPKDQASARRLQRRQLARALPSASNRRDPERNSCAAWARGQSAAWLPTVVATKVPKNTARFHDRREGLETGVGTVSKKANSIWRPAPRSRGTRPPRL